MRRKMSVALAATIVAGTLAGCSGGTSGLPGDTTAADITVGKESVEKDTAENGDKPYAGTTIRVLSMTGQISDALEANLEQFEEETGINTVVAEDPGMVVAVGTGQYLDVMSKVEGK